MASTVGRKKTHIHEGECTIWSKYYTGTCDNGLPEAFLSAHALTYRGRKSFETLNILKSPFLSPWQAKSNAIRLPEQAESMLILGP
jgi:hypothetical protein